MRYAISQRLNIYELNLTFAFNFHELKVWFNGDGRSCSCKVPYPISRWFQNEVSDFLLDRMTCTKADFCPISVIREIGRINERELDLGGDGVSSSWHDDYKGQSPFRLK